MVTQTPQQPKTGISTTTIVDEEDRKYSSLHVRLLEEESRQRVKADYKEFEQITSVWVLFFMISLMAYRYVWDHPGSWGWVSDAPYGVWLVLGIISPSFLFSRIPRSFLFYEERSDKKEKTIERETVKNVERKSSDTDQLDEMTRELRAAKGLRIQGRE